MPVSRERILYDDDSLLIVSKRSGELTVAGKGTMQTLPLLDFLKVDHPSLLAIHRLDFETSGVVAFAKSSRVLRSILDAEFSGWKKEYLALVSGVPKRTSGVITLPLTPRSGVGKVSAETAYDVLERFPVASLLRCTIERGQRHQIRRHLAMIGHPLLLDEEHGDPKVNRRAGKFLRMQRFFLHASALTFPHPMQSGTLVTVSCPLPPAFEGALKKLRSLTR